MSFTSKKPEGEPKRVDQRGQTDEEIQAKADQQKTHVPMNPFQADAAARYEDDSIKGTSASYDFRAQEGDKEVKSPKDLKVSYDVVQKDMDDKLKQAHEKRKQAQQLTDEAAELEKAANVHKENLAHMQR